MNPLIVLVVGVIIALVLLLVLVGTIISACRKASRKVENVTNSVKEFSRAAFGTDNIVEGLQKAEAEYEETPKSVSAGTNLYLPRITKDFPDFHYDEMKNRAENVLVSYLRALDMKDVSKLTEGLEELKEQLQMRIQMAESVGEQEHYKQIKVHQSAIYQYNKQQGRCTVVFQMAVQYYYHKEKNGKVVAGSPNNKKQSRYNVECIYIQNRDFIENVRDASLALNCPNCGAPLENLGTKQCAYCGTPIVEFNIHAWHFSSVDES